MRKIYLAITSFLWVFSVSAFYSDVTMESPIYPAIKYLTEKNYVKGYADNTFGKTKHINRAEALKIILIATDTQMPPLTGSPYPDVPGNAWFAPYVSYAKQKEIVKGDALTGNFAPERVVNRAEFLKMLLQAFDVKISDYKLTKNISDVPSDAWFAPYMRFAAEFGILPLDNGSANPSQPLSRGEAGYFLYKALERGRGLNPQIMLDLMDRHMVHALKSLESKNYGEAALASGIARTYGASLESFLSANVTVQSAVALSESVSSIIGAHVSAKNGDIEAVIIASKKAWESADKAQKIDATKAGPIGTEIKRIAETLATSAREKQKSMQ